MDKEILGKKILVVDDLEGMRSLLIEELLSLGFERPLEAEDGAEALEILKNNFGTPNQVEIIISDYEMPIMNGYEFLTAIKADPQFKDIPFLIVSALTDKKEVLRCIKAGVSNFVIKPITSKSLEEKITNLFKPSSENLNEPTNEGELESTFGEAFDFADKILNSMFDGVIVVNHHGTIQKVNKATADLLGTTLDLVAGKILPDIFLNMDLINEKIESVEKTKMPETNISSLMIIPGEDPKDCLVSITPSGDDLIFCVKDISELESLKKNLNLSQNLNSVINMANLSELYSRIAHEVRNPLACISMISQRAITCLEKDKPQDALDQLNNIKKHVKVTTEIFDNMKKLARGQCWLEGELCSVKSIVDDTLLILSVRLKNDDITLNLEITDEVKAIKIPCRSTQIIQILVNLINNAMDEVLGVDQHKITLKVTLEDSNIVFAVSDSGSGVPQDLRSEIFKPFFSTKNKGAGTGLGLSIASKIAIDHSGEIFFDEQSAESTFKLVLPLENESLMNDEAKTIDISQFIVNK